MNSEDDQSSNGSEPLEPELQPITLDELRRRAICKKRYGRATLIGAASAVSAETST
jgi:hypothetical protein